MNLIRHPAGSFQEDVSPGSERTEMYFSRLEGKKLGIVANQTSRIKETHLVERLAALRSAGITISKLFGPEHGYRGQCEDAVPVNDDVYQGTGTPIISLYGQKLKPGAADLEDLDLLVFDIQDVGVRFYTYISTLFYVMQAAAEMDIELLLLDRPNPNGFYVDGPVLEPGFSSFEGLYEVPVVYGMTIGEYALMINGEGWLGENLNCKLTIIPCEHYSLHS